MNWCEVQLFFGAPPRPKVIGKLSIRQVQMWNFTRVRPQTKKLWLSIILARTLSEQPGLGPPQKGVNCHFSSPHLDKPYVVGKLSISEAYICSFSRMGQKIKNLQLFEIFAWKLRKFRLTERLSCPSRGIDNFSLAQLHELYVVGKLSISSAEKCIFQQDRT